MVGRRVMGPSAGDGTLEAGSVRRSCLLQQLCASGRAYQGSVPEYLRTWECPENSPEISLGIK